MIQVLIFKYHIYSLGEKENINISVSYIQCVQLRYKNNI